jgi:hypothetical protein
MSFSAYKILIGKPERKAQLGMSRRMWESNIKPNIKEVGLYIISHACDLHVINALNALCRLSQDTYSSRTAWAICGLHPELTCVSVNEILLFRVSFC